MARKGPSVPREASLAGFVPDSGSEAVTPAPEPK